MTRPTTTGGDLFAQVIDPANRPNPYPLYARLRETPVSLQDDGTYIVSTHTEIAELLHDPRISSDERKSARGARVLAEAVTERVQQLAPEEQEATPAFIGLDSPDHDRLRRLLMRQFTPARVEGMRDQIVQLVDGLLDARRERGQIDVVDDLAYPLPVTVICELLGVPREDEPRFHAWASALVRRLDPEQGMSEEKAQQAAQAGMQLVEYMAGLVNARRAQPADDLLSALVAGDDTAGRMGERALISTMALLLIAGHETTVNLISNGMLTLLRHPDALERLRREPKLVIRLVEEVLRYDPPVQFRNRTTLADIDVAGVTVPKGATVVLLLASGSRDERRFPNADQFIPDRTNNAHLGFGGGIHYCVGAPLARMEAQIALGKIARRLVGPRLIADPPPYRENAALRGPEHLLVVFDRMQDRANS